jgi:hypothetical protein
VVSGVCCLVAWSENIKLLEAYTLLLLTTILFMSLAHFYAVSRPSPNLVNSMALSMHRYGRLSQHYYLL